MKWLSGFPLPTNLACVLSGYFALRFCRSCRIMRQTPVVFPLLLLSKSGKRIPDRRSASRRIRRSLFYKRRWHRARRRQYTNIHIPRYVYMLNGTLTVVDVATKQTFAARKGGFLPEIIDTWHYSENRGTLPVRLIAIDQVPEGTRNNTALK